MKKPDEFYSVSKQHNNLWFTSDPPGKKAYFEHLFGYYNLEGRILYNKSGENPWIFSIHGARADLSKADAVTFGLQKRGYSILSMNMSGHSRAGTLNPEQTTLGNNIQEVKAFYQYLDNNHKKVVIAYSLGGTPALKLLETFSNDIDKLILFYPGIYAIDAYDKHFGAEFNNVISEPFSYRKNDTIELLRSFQGDLLLIKGQYDGLDPKDFGKPEGGSTGQVEVDGHSYYSPIPREVVDMIYNAVPESRRKLIEILSCGHSVILWMRDHPKEAEELLDQIDDFLRH